MKNHRLASPQNIEYSNMTINKLNAIIFCIEADNCLLKWCNEATEIALGYSQTEMLQMGTDFFKTILHPEEYANTLQVIKQFLSGEKSRYFAFFRLGEKNGVSWQWVYGNIAFYERNQTYQIKSLLCIFQKIDITDSPEQAHLAFQHLMHDINQSRWRELSKRQIAILKLMKEGYKSPAIAKKLFISHETVKAELKKMHQSFKVHTATALIVIAIKMGL